MPTKAKERKRTFPLLLTERRAIEEDGASYVDRLYSRAYLRHLFVSDELLALQIASLHNLAFYVWLTGEARKHILLDDYASWKKEMLERVTYRL